MSLDSCTESPFFSSMLDNLNQYNCVGINNIATRLVSWPSSEFECPFSRAVLRPAQPRSSHNPKKAVKGMALPPQLFRAFENFRDQAKDAIWALSSCLCQQTPAVKINGRTCEFSITGIVWITFTNNLLLTVQIIKVLGEGGFSFVYLAQDEHSGVRSAIYCWGLAMLNLGVSVSDNLHWRKYDVQRGHKELKKLWGKWRHIAASSELFKLGHNLYSYYWPFPSLDTLILFAYWYTSISYGQI